MLLIDKYRFPPEYVENMTLNKLMYWQSVIVYYEQRMAELRKNKLPEKEGAIDFDVSDILKEQGISEELWNNSLNVKGYYGRK